ncbi:hypothetical protein CHS0354_014454 [Potamilus streckersoni]|uniref:C2H2-type domain-containing protein n=1 Tax=Potamilus streckersoni TaxID=2493646 RepID=A0AAE0VRX2_9BIVA|nr:hypothetical protein CHS0354_014454 [Potamilus streckersoni]
MSNVYCISINIEIMLQSSIFFITDFNPIESCVFFERSTNNTQVEEYKSLHVEFTLYEKGGFEDIFSKLGEVELNKSHKCKVCSRRFSEISDLEQHKKYHKDFSTYRCDICDRRFSTKREMDEHRIYHKDFRLCQCCIFCGSIFSTINEMEKHKKNHNDFHLYPSCRICGAIFSTMNEMETHKSHHQDLSHQKCDICDKRFYTMSELEQHNRHHQEFRHTQSDVSGQIVSKKRGKKQRG